MCQKGALNPQNVPSGQFIYKEKKDDEIHLWIKKESCLRQVYTTSFAISFDARLTFLKCIPRGQTLGIHWGLREAHVLGVRREARKEAMKTCLAAAIFTLGVPNKHACTLY